MTYLHTLANICTSANSWLHDHRCNDYQWHCGGNGPLFSIARKTSNTAKSKNNDTLRYYLRSTTIYDENVNDEWYAIHRVAFQMVPKLQQRFETNDIRLAVECIDNNDGQIILIEGAHFLPPWVDELTHAKVCERGRGRCFIVDREVLLIPPPHEPNASSILDNKSAAAKGVTNTILQRMERVVPGDKVVVHRCAIVVPRSVGIVLRRHPHVLNSALSCYF
eukprot:CAMPEP_0194373520 /NCGR_PEP_ID=MMETSP0174-20130528/22000_1 /TAXON_ID=216777 /ORGANISM="Proboscia alata, Strain PI-D3" /LENGTH=220 /DNA_ID=CAMNT_0039152665 /DNA_START=314 /DNA_END=973 /DNA_ORIENTATION=+